MKTFATIGLAAGFLLAAPLKAPATLPVIDYAEQRALDNARQTALAGACPAAYLAREAEKQAEIGLAVAAVTNQGEGQ
ncbi:MAG TPA: hypothetical protein VGD78_17460 [Chthoniobacterales bacterium]